MRMRPWLLPATLLGLAAAAQVAGGVDATVRELAVCADPANMPYSNERGEGYENRIADLLASELHAQLRYTWNMQRRSFLRRTLNAHRCDVVIGMPPGIPGLASTRPLYTSSYVFVTARARHAPPKDFDDPALRDMRIGLQALGAEGANPPPAMALARRGLVQHIVGFPMWADEDEESPVARLIDAVAKGDLDVAIVWGPFAGWFARGYGEALQLTPAGPDPQMPALAFSYPMSLAVRRDDSALRDELQAALDRRQQDIAAILRDYRVPLLDTTPPTTAASSSSPESKAR